MCGIAGIVRFDDQPIEVRRLEAMRDQLRHRGPDGEGVEVLGRCGMAHTRLSIIDLLGGHQPMRVPGVPSVTDASGDNPMVDYVEKGSLGQLTLVFNGEIYNHRSLRKKLERLGHQFVSDHCDTEVLLHGFRQWGTELPKLLHGMFAFAVWDAGGRKLFLCRDRMGKKPLYLRWGSGGGGSTGRGGRNGARELTFGSLVSTLIAGLPSGERPAVDRDALLHYLRFGYTAGHAMVRGVEELPCAHWMLVDHGGGVTMQRYWRPPPVSRTSTSLGAADATRELLEEAVAKRLESDVPLGCFLSGGIDSSLIAAMAQRELARRGEGPLKTFCVRMPDADYDESGPAGEAARHIGSTHTELVAQPHAEAIDDLAQLVAIMGEPTADSSILPTLWLSQATRQHVKVALSGDGGDELFGGYDRYRAMRLVQKHRWWLRMLPRGMVGSQQPRSRLARLRRLLDAAAHGSPAQQYFQMIHLFQDDQIRAMGLWPGENADATMAGEPGDGPMRLRRDLSPIPTLADIQGIGAGVLSTGVIAPADSAASLAQADADLVGGPHWPHDIDPVHAAMRWDLCNYLPFELLRKMDRAAMSVALEVRCPLLDTQVCDLAGHLPPSVLMPGGRPKGLLRQVAAGYLPASIVNRPKRGFAIPIGRWFRGPLRKRLHQHLLDGSLTNLGVNKQFIEGLIYQHMQQQRDHTHRLFGLLMLELWASQVMAK